ncbi:hypothetical protein CHU98_g5557 [Xylaria longipes]|nr:hypothetical protein CHU98_g5557 [Xylaria longipes]
MSPNTENNSNTDINEQKNESVKPSAESASNTDNNEMDNDAVKPGSNTGTNENNNAFVSLNDVNDPYGKEYPTSSTARFTAAPGSAQGDNSSQSSTPGPYKDPNSGNTFMGSDEAVDDDAKGQ